MGFLEPQQIPKAWDLDSVNARIQPLKITPNGLKRIFQGFATSYHRCLSKGITDLESFHSFCLTRSISTPLLTQKPLETVLWKPLEFGLGMPLSWGSTWLVGQPSLHPIVLATFSSRPSPLQVVPATPRPHSERHLLVPPRPPPAT